MKILDRYLIGHFLRPLAACMVIFSILVLLGHFFDKMEVFNRFNARIADIVFYVALGIPYWLNIIFPVVTLLALMFSLGPLQQGGEITAMRGAGISFGRLYAPFLAIGVLISLISLIGGMTTFPAMSAKANVIYRRDIKHQQIVNTLRDHIVVSGRDHQIFTIGTLDTQTGSITNIVIDQFDGQNHLTGRVTAQQGHYQNNEWLFNNGNIVRFDSNGNFHYEPFQGKLLDIHEKPEDFVYDDRRPDDMTHRQIVQRIRHLQEIGVPSSKEQVALHLQYALPFANVVVILLGIPFALSSRKKGNVQAISYAFGAMFLYWGAVSVFQSFGERGHIPAWVSAWSANFIFGAAAVWLLGAAPGLMNLYKRLTRYLDPYLGRLIIATLCMGAVAALNALRIYLVKPLQDQVFIGHDLSMLHQLLWWIPTISVSLGLFAYIQNYTMEFIGLRATGDIRQQLFDHVQLLSMDFFTASSSGKLVARFTNDLDALQKVIARAPIYLIRDGLTAICNIGLIFYLNWRFALMTVCLLPFTGAIIALLGKTLRKVGRKGQQQMGDLFAVIQENIQAAAVVKAYTAERLESARFRKSNEHYVDLSLRFARADTVSSPIMEVIGALILALLLWKGEWTSFITSGRPGRFWPSSRTPS